MSQCAAILEYLEAGNTITPAEAFTRFGTLALHSRIAELRERGVAIDCEIVRLNGKNVGRYSMPLLVAYG